MDVEKHELVPKHTKVNDKEREQLLSQYSIAVKQLPRMMKSDSAIENLDLKAGDVVKIERSSATAGKTTYYRLVIEG